MRIALVEDDHELRAGLARRLRAQGHAVDESGDLATLRSLFRVHTYDLLVLDRRLPDGDSLERLPGWRREGLKAAVLMLTARDAVQDRVAGFEAGADDYLVKPFAIEELLARVQALARRADSGSPSVMQVGDLEVDLGRRAARRAGVLIPLRPKEFVLLELLLTREGRVVTKAEIHEACWDAAREPESNVEEVLVASLRRKLGEPRLIHTVRGTGYRLEADSHGS